MQKFSLHGTGVGAVVVFLDFAAFFFADLAEVGAADTVGAALMVGWFVGLLVLDPFLVLVVFRSVVLASTGGVQLQGVISPP